MKRLSIWAASIAMIATATITMTTNTAHALNGKVLMLDSTLSGGASSDEAQEVTALGLTPEIVDAATWASKSTADFADYRAIVLGDPDCQGLSSAQAASDNASTWGAAVTGNVIINGTDPVFHRIAGIPGAGVLTRNSVDFAVADSSKTGAYISLSCYYHGAPDSSVPLLSGLDGTDFHATGVGCFNDSHIVATHPALASLTDADLSGWSCSVHEGLSQFPASYLPLAIAQDAPGANYTAADGTMGFPYIVARGKGLKAISAIQLSPDSDSKNTGQSTDIKVTIKDTNGDPLAGANYHLVAISGPNKDSFRNGTTGADGTFTESYTSAAAGNDVWEAMFVDANGHTQTSNDVTRAWTQVLGATITTTKTTVLDATLANTGAPSKTPQVALFGFVLLPIGLASLSIARLRRRRA